VPKDFEEYLEFLEEWLEKLQLTGNKEDLEFLEKWIEKPQLTGNCIAGEKNEKNKNCIDLNILMNGFESAGFDIWEQQAEVEEVKYCIEVPKLVNTNEFVVEEKDIVVFIYNQDLEFVDDIMDEEEIEKVNKFFMQWS
jgi:beta-galactosidase beta subunit